MFLPFFGNVASERLAKARKHFLNDQTGSGLGPDPVWFFGTGAFFAAAIAGAGWLDFVEAASEDARTDVGLMLSQP